MFSALDTNKDGTVSLEELTAQAPGKMIAALGERYDTQGRSTVGGYLNTAA